MIGLPSSLNSRTLRGRVTLFLNGASVILLGLFLLIDFQRDFTDRLALKRTALDEQARLIEPGITDQLAAGSDSLKEFLQAIHDRMDGDRPSQLVRFRLRGAMPLRRGEPNSAPSVSFHGPEVLV